MTYNEFVNICENRCILPEIALENETIEQACRDGATPETIAILLDEEF